jgi:hypothetical protein
VSKVRRQRAFGSLFSGARRPRRPAPTDANHVRPIRTENQRQPVHLQPQSRRQLGIILTSERYTRKASALDGIESIRINSAIDSRFQRKTSSADQPDFVLVAGNSEPVGDP